MKKLTFDFDKDALKIFFEENRVFLIPAGVIFVSILLSVFFVIPQVNGFFQKQSQVNPEREKLSNLAQSLSALSLANDAVLEADLKIASLALPPNKDFAQILNSISSAASLSGVSLGDFEFQIGDITKVSQQTTGTPNLKISINISGNVGATARFINELKKSVPISSIAGVKSSGNFSTLEIVFYYKPFPPSGITDPEKIRSVSQASQKVIDEISIPPNIDLNNLPGRR